jgi:hypothetical protein
LWSQQTDKRKLDRHTFMLDCTSRSTVRQMERTSGKALQNSDRSWSVETIGFLPFYCRFTQFICSGVKPYLRISQDLQSDPCMEVRRRNMPTIVVAKFKSLRTIPLTLHPRESLELFWRNSKSLNRGYFNVTNFVLR